MKTPAIKSMNPIATSVCLGPQNAILIGTRGGEIVETKGNQQPAVRMRAHFDQELWGLAMHPSKTEMITVGRDAMLAVWDMPTRKQKMNIKLAHGADAVAFNNNATHIAVGMTNGKLQIFDSEFNIIRERNDRKGKAIQVLKYSPDNTKLAVGGHDSQICVYDVNRNYAPIKRIKSHHSTITHLDFSEDSSALMSNCTSYEILFHDMSTCKQVTSGASNYKNEQWASWSCTLGWPVQGIFPPCADGSDINACERSPDRTVLATGDDFRMVKLFRYPCPVEEAAYQKYSGHSEHITNIGFSRNN